MNETIILEASRDSMNVQTNKLQCSILLYLLNKKDLRSDIFGKHIINFNLFYNFDFLTVRVSFLKCLRCKIIFIRVPELQCELQETKALTPFRLLRYIFCSTWADFRLSFKKKKCNLERFLSKMF